MFVKGGVTALVIAGVLGCAGSRVTGSPKLGESPEPSLTIASIAGEYALVAVDGHALPYAPRGAAGVAARPVVSGRLLLNSSGIFRLQTTYDASDTAPAFSGACYTEGNEVKMVWDGGGLTNMTFRGDTMVLKREGTLYAYLRGR